VAAALRQSDESMAVSDSKEEEKTPNNDCELNSGVECPGKSIEQLCGANMTIEDKSFYNQVILVEIATPKFAFKFEKQERVFVGTCEWCNTRNQLNQICKCKRVRYCDETCMEKDKRFHIP
jgi:hypothetical protein